MKTKILTVAVVAILGLTAAAVIVNLDGNDEDESRGGLYDLGALVLNVDMGGVTASPKMIDTLEYLYTEVYGETLHSADDFTMDDLMTDQDFWDEYCDYESIITENEDGTYEVITTFREGTSTVNLEEADRMLSTSTMYMTTVYYLICDKFNVEPYSAEALTNVNLVNEFQKIVAGGTTLSYIENQTELFDYFDSDVYLEGSNSVRNYDHETLGEHVRELLERDPEAKIIFVGSGTSMTASDIDGITDIVDTQGGEAAIFASASNIKDTFGNIEMLATVLGYKENVEDIIQDLQKRLYAVYLSLQEQEDTHKVYWESSGGTAIRDRGMSAALMSFMGWDTSLLGMGAVDLETLLYEQPDIMIFYSNDTREDDVKMRIAT